MRFGELYEGGWASAVTQNTIVTPELVANAIALLNKFATQFNAFIAQDNMGPIEIGPTAGSTAYYERDLKVNPTREYGDIDVNVFIPRVEGLTNNANISLYSEKVKEFCKRNKEYSTENGTNVLFNIGQDYVQVDLIMSYYDSREWITALKPAYNVKGVLCGSLYSSLGEALSLSVGGGHGVQAKLQNGNIVPFKTVKNVELVTVTKDPKTWAVDIAKFLGAKKIDPLLTQYAGMIEEPRVPDMINSIKGIAKTLGANGIYNEQNLLTKVAEIYKTKIQKAIDSSKYDKAATPAAIEKAEKTKKMLAEKLAEILQLLTP